MGWRWYWKSWDRCEDLIQSSWRLTQSILLIGTILPLALVVWKLHARPPQESRTSGVVSLPRSGDASVGPLADGGVTVRPLLPYSVIPGGAADGTELRTAIAHDPVVAGHYLPFDLAKIHVIRLDRDRTMYVSYRMGDYVYWTKRKLLLPRGETLLTDGQHLARTRCGNRLSETAEVPTSLREPERAALETLQPPELFAFAPPPELPASPIGPLSGPPSEAPSNGGHIFFPPVIPIFWGSGTPPPLTPTPPGTPTPGPPHPHTPHLPAPPGGTPGGPPVTSIPEPGTVLLLSAGLTAIGLARLMRRESHSARS